MDRLTGIHAVREALEAGRAFDRIVIARGRQDTRVEDIVRLARERNISVRFEDRGQLDRLADSKDHQGGVALAAGAHGVVVAERRAAGLTDTVARASAGALSHMPVAKVTNLARAMEELKEAGYWLIGLDEDAEKSYTQADYTSPVGIVLGSEGKGLHELTRKRCDFVVSLPTVGPVKSLNVSVAAGVVLFEAVRQRKARN